jgi:hypothetical protein
VVLVQLTLYCSAMVLTTLAPLFYCSKMTCNKELILLYSYILHLVQHAPNEHVHVACKRHPFDPLLRRLIPIDVTGELETAPTARSLHLTRTTPTHGPLQSPTCATRSPSYDRSGLICRPRSRAHFSRYFHRLLPPPIAFSALSPPCCFRWGAALDPVVVSSLPRPPSI